MADAGPWPPPWSPAKVISSSVSTGADFNLLWSFRFIKLESEKNYAKMFIFPCWKELIYSYYYIVSMPIMLMFHTLNLYTHLVSLMLLFIVRGPIQVVSLYVKLSPGPCSGPRATSELIPWRSRPKRP